MKIIISKTEVSNTIEEVIFDPCTHIECGDLDCCACPLREYAQNLRIAQEQFVKALHTIEVEGE